jgi:hypothetical protein
VSFFLSLLFVRSTHTSTYLATGTSLAITIGVFGLG